MRWVITGASRGIGLEFVRQLAARGDEVVAAARDANNVALTAIVKKSEGRVRALACDVVNDQSVRKFARELGDVAVDVLVNNAGVGGKWQGFEELDLEEVKRTFDVNALGPIRVTRALMPQILKGATRRVVHITSGMGSIADNSSGGAYGYRMSKAALNMANKSFSVDYKDKGIIAAVMNPGWVATDMGGDKAPLPVEESVKLMLARIDALTPAENGAFLNYKGGVFPY